MFVQIPSLILDTRNILYIKEIGMQSEVIFENKTLLIDIHVNDLLKKLHEEEYRVLVEKIQCLSLVKKYNCEELQSTDKI